MNASKKKVIFLLVILALTSVIMTRSLEAQPPSPSGDWTIEPDETYTLNQPTIVNGSIIVKGTLIVDHTELIMGLKSDGEHKIVVVDGGNLTVIGSTVRSNNSDYRFAIQIRNGKFKFINSTFRDLGYANESYPELVGPYSGIYMYKSTGKMDNLKIYSNVSAFYLNQSSNISIKNILFYGNSINWDEIRPAFEIHESENVTIDNFTVEPSCSNIDGPFIIKLSNNVTILNSNFTSIERRLYGGAIIEKSSEISINDTTITSNFDGIRIISSENITLKNVSITCGFYEGMSALNMTKSRSIRILKSYFNNTYETQSALPGVYIYNSSFFEINDSLIYGYYTGLFIDNSSYFRINGTKMVIHVLPHPSEPSNAAVYINDTNIFFIANSELNGTFIAQGIFNVTVENVSVLNESFYNIFAGALMNITNVNVSRPLAVDSILEGFETINIENSHLKEKDVYYGPIEYFFNVTVDSSTLTNTGEAIIIHCPPVDLSGIPAVELSRTNDSRLSDISYSFLIGYSHNITVENSDTKLDFFNMLYLVNYVNISDSEGNYVTFNSSHGLMENMAMYMTSFEDSYNWTVRNVYNAISFSIKAGSGFFIENITGMSPPPPDSTIMMYFENVINVNITKIESMIIQIMSSQDVRIEDSKPNSTFINWSQDIIVKDSIIHREDGLTIGVMGADDVVFFRCDIFSRVDDAIYVMDSNLTVIFSNLTTADSSSYSIHGVEHENLWLLLALNQIYNTSYLYSDSGGPLPKVIDSSVYGNWWKEYTGTDSDVDGVGDTPFEENNIKDRYPLVFKPKYREMITGIEETEDEIVASADASELYLVYILDNGTVKSSEFTWNGTHYVVLNPKVEKWGILARDGEFFDVYLEALMTLGKPIKGDTIPPVIKSVTLSPEEPTSKDNVTVYIEAYDGESSIASVKLYYKVDTSWEEVAVTYDTNLKKWVGEIIHQPEGSHVQFKVVVTDEFGNSAEELKEYTVKMLPPVIEEISWEPQEPYSNESVTVFVKVSDDTEVDTVILSYNNGTGWVNVTMTYNDKTGYWEAVIPKHPSGTKIEFKIYANDTFGNYAVSQVKSYEVKALPSGPGISPVMIGIVIVVVITLTAGALIYIQKIRK